MLRVTSAAYLIVFSNFADKVSKSLIDVDPLFGRRLDEFASEMFCQITALYYYKVSLCNRRQ